MNLDFDLRFRLTAFEHVLRLRDEGGGVVKWQQLNAGMQFDGQRYPIWNQQKGIFRPAVLRESGAALTIQTAFAGPYEDRWDPQDERLVYRYRGTDPLHPDNVALRRALELQRPVLYLVAIKPGIYDAIAPCYVTDDNPAALAFFLIADAEEYVGGPVMDSTENWPRKAYITRAVKQRLHQQRFRSLVLTAYREQCAMCRLKHASLLEAAHILPDRDVRGNPEVPNGLSLCRIHHGAYDVGILGVDGDYRLHLRPDVLEEHDGPILRHGLQELHGAAIILPRREGDKPRREYLAERFERFRAV